MIKKSISIGSVFIVVWVLFAVVNVNVAHALRTIESGCLDCHYRGSNIVPGAKQFENNTAWHDFHRRYNCSSCHPSGAGSTPIQVASCGSCHNTTCAWQDFHENNVGQTCYDCHNECYIPPTECGNNIIEAGEQCDDGNTVNGDCCNANCQFEQAGSPCPDNVYCNGQESCDGGGACRAGTPIDCNDGVDCTEDTCNENNRTCVNTPNNRNCSDDGLFCNGDEFCDLQNDCSSTGDPCQNGLVCNEPNGSCDPQSACGDGTVDPGEDCDDGNVEDGDCCSAFCEFEVEGSSCADNQYCNGEETCDGTGACQSGMPIDCADGLECTVDSCDEANDSCTNTPDNTNCDDGQYCNGVEVCDLSTGCVPGTPVNCSDGIDCTNDSCDETNDRCEYTPDDNNCPDDGLFCNGDEFCHPQNNCSSTGDPCLNGTTCNETNGSCVLRPVCGNGTQDQGEDCDDGNVEDGDCCSAFCTFEPAGSSCADDQYCNGDETCDGNGTCQAGIPIDCSDGVDCTVDSCDEVNEVCVNMPNDNNCADDGLFCNGQETCNVVDGCVSSGNPCPVEELCDEGSNQCATSPECAIDEDCDDGLFCNGNELCDDAGMCQPGAGPCPPEETCNEESGQCVAGEADLDIAGLRVTKGVRLKRVKDIEIKLVVKNNGGNNGGQRRATITGVQNEDEVYEETMLVNDPANRGRTTFTFPAYRPEQEGIIEWEATIDDDDSDDDTRKARTVVLP